IHVEEGATTAECLKVARAVATSPLIKTAFFASDPNWGRILAAVGRSAPSDLDISRVSLMLNDVCIVERGRRAGGYREEAGRRVMSEAEIKVTIRLGRGGAREILWTCDLSQDYVKINAGYRS
ncbi:MAG: bifunctional ornithine acetyltransferase/N-acetylglutamate synthase, partial [Gammaproteobacteria bacterium]|nr:bifunctional ornithine acetyltransferase/N-acetylglutamate synthase [Gammaproteobacteria bacterium]